MKNLLSILTLILFLNVISLAQINELPESILQCQHAKILNHLHSNQNIPMQSPLLHNYDVNFYFLDLNVSDTSTYISGNVRIDAKVTAAIMDTFAVELVSEMIIDSVIFRNMNLNFIRENDLVKIPLNEGLLPEESFSCRIYYEGYPPATPFFSGVYNEYSSEWETQVTWTLSEPFSAKLWWPTKQVLEDKADSVWVFLTTDQENKAGSQGLLQGVVPLGNQQVRYEWKSRYPINYYLISFAVADYTEYNIYAKPDTGPADSILIQNYIYDAPGCLEHYKSGIDRTAAFLELFSDIFSTYPFYKEKYGHCLTELGGGMEHQTMSTMGGFGFGLVAHELGHMWFGDNVTCATWSDIWINEGFATYSDFLAHQYVAQGQWPQIWLNQVKEQILSKPGGSVYIPPELITENNVYRIFDGRLSYAKGSYLVHMIRFELQDDSMFYDVLRTFQQEFADSVASGLDFMHVLNELSGKDFTYFFDQWYFGEGHPVYDIYWNYQNDTFYLSSIQTPSVVDGPFFKMLMEYKLNFSDNTDTLVIFEHTTEVQDFAIALDKQVTSIEVDPLNWVLEKTNNIVHGIGENGIGNRLVVAPNPGRGNITLHMPQHNPCKKIQLYNLQGKLLFVSHETGTKIQLDLTQYPAGIYLARVTTEKGSFVEKVVIE